MKIAMLTLSAFLAITAAAQPNPPRCCMGSGQQAGAKAPVTSQPIVEIKGEISKVQISPGQGMPYLEVKRGSEVTRLYLGAMHYLISENFNPKAGQQITAKGYKMTDSVIGIEVTLTAEKKTLKLRDERGWPLWRGGCWRSSGTH
jgi:hypothetical protein